MKEKNEALQFAMKLIGLRMRSVLEIKTRLEKKGFGTKIINEVLRDLEKYRYTNDEQFAESYINDRMNFRPCGNFLIRKELKEKGVEENIIERKIEELIGEEIEIASAKKLAEKKLRTISDKTDKSKINQKVRSYLQSRGYSFDIISRVIEDEVE
ncbi:MAG: regulatory protein RecX [Candidatus Pacebacteria bacterium]|nr:regulatory protein RecX [Candidatus Paceibacterota bacterium]